MVKVNEKLCIGCGMCANVCPEVFIMNNLGKSEVVSNKTTECVKSAAANCPVDAIKL